MQLAGLAARAVDYNSGCKSLLFMLFSAVCCRNTVDMVRLRISIEVKSTGHRVSRLSREEGGPVITHDASFLMRAIELRNLEMQINREATRIAVIALAQK